MRLRLWAVVAGVRLPIDAGARLLLDRLVAIAVERLQRDDADTARIDEAVDDLRRLVDDMTQQARILRFDALHPPQVVGALARARPLWPFC